MVLSTRLFLLSMLPALSALDGPAKFMAQTKMMQVQSDVMFAPAPQSFVQQPLQQQQQQQQQLYVPTQPIQACPPPHPQQAAPPQQMVCGN